MGGAGWGWVGWGGWVELSSVRIGGGLEEVMWVVSQLMVIYRSTSGAPWGLRISRWLLRFGLTLGLLSALPSKSTRAQQLKSTRAQGIDKSMTPNWGLWG